MNSEKESVKFSILVPVYNVEKYVEACIQSVLNQSYSNFELILVDDGSTDKSGEICDKYAAASPKIKVFHKPNQGLLHTRRFGISKASGDYYIFLDSDDSLKLNALKVIYDSICRTQADCVIYGFDRVFDGQVIDNVSELEETVITDKHELYCKVFSWSGYNAIWRKAVKSSVFAGVDYSDYYFVSLGEDLLQSIEIYKNCEKAVFITDSLYNYSFNPKSITNRVNYDNYSFDIFTVLSKALDFIKEENIFSAKDYYQLRTNFISMTKDEIVRICNSNLKFKFKLKLLKKIRESDVYLSFMNTSDYDKKALGRSYLYFDLFRFKMHFVLALGIPFAIKLKNLFK